MQNSFTSDKELNILIRGTHCCHHIQELQLFKNRPVFGPPCTCISIQSTEGKGHIPFYWCCNLHMSYSVVSYFKAYQRWYRLTVTFTSLHISGTDCEMTHYHNAYCTFQRWRWRRRLRCWNWMPAVDVSTGARGSRHPVMVYKILIVCFRVFVSRLMAKAKQYSILHWVIGENYSPD